MGVYAYCVTPLDHEPLGLEGITGTAVFGAAIGRFGVWFSEMEKPEPSIEAIQAHNRVIEAAVNNEVTPVPLRFGQWFAEMEALRAPLLEKQDWYVERLAAFAGALEFGMRVADPGRREAAQVVRPATAESGSAYMKQLQDSVTGAQQQRAEAERIGSRIGDVMSEIVRESKQEDARTPHGILTVAHLVSRENFQQYHERATSLRAMFPDLRFLVSGPWAPYSFAT